LEDLLVEQKLPPLHESIKVFFPVSNNSKKVLILISFILGQRKNSDLAFYLLKDDYYVCYDKKWHSLILS